MAMTAATDTYTLPSGIERIVAMYVTPVGNYRSRPLEETSIGDLIEKKVGTTSTSDQSGQYVTHYAVLGIDQIVVWPTPQTTDTLTVWYVTLPTALSADADVPIIHEPYGSKLLFYGAAADAGSFKGDPQGQEYAALFEQWLGRYRTHLNRKKGTSTRQFRVVGQQTYRPHDPSVDLPWNY